MPNTKNLTSYAAVLAVSAVSACAPLTVGYYSPATGQGARDAGDHSVIYHHITGGGFADLVAEAIWEDGWAFQIKKGQATVASLPEASPYWGYSLKDGIHFFFVDEMPLGEWDVGDKAREAYGYILITEHDDKVQSFSCKFLPRSSLVRDQRALKIEKDGLDPTAYLITKKLARDGERLLLDDCKPRELEPHT